MPEGVIGAKSWMSFLEPGRKWAIEVVDRKKTFASVRETPEEEIPLPDLGVETTNSSAHVSSEWGSAASHREQELTSPATSRKRKDVKLIVSETRSPCASSATGKAFSRAENARRNSCPAAQDQSGTPPDAAEDEKRRQVHRAAEERWRGPRTA